MNAPIRSPRHADHPVDDLFTGRWSPRSFTDAPIAEDELLTLLEAARWAPSASNHQPWRFAYGLRGDPGFAAIVDALVPSNAVWAAKAAALVVVGSRTTVTRDGAELPNGTHAFDAGAAWVSLAFQAHMSRWVAHAMAGFDKAKARASLNAPDGYDLHAVVAIGRQGVPEALPEKLRPREVPSTRRPLAEVAGKGGFV